MSIQFDVNGVLYRTVSKTTVHVCEQLRGNLSANLIVPEVVRHNGCQYTVTGIGYGAFYLYNNLESVVLPDTITHISDLAFRECGNLKHIVLPNQLISIGNWAFYFCASLEGCLKFPKSLKFIGTNAFQLCWGLTSVVLPKNLVSIGNYAFDDCHYLSNIKFKGDECVTIGTRSFDGRTSPLFKDSVKRTLYVKSNPERYDLSEWCADDIQIYL